MRHALRKVVTIPHLIFWLNSNLKKQKAFQEKTLAIDLKNFKTDPDGSLSEKDFYKINTYYGQYVAAILGEGFCLLRGKAMTESERVQLTYLGGTTGLFDDFFDEQNVSHHHLKQLIHNPEKIATQNSHEKLFITFYMKALSYGDDARIKSFANNVLEAQIESQKQQFDIAPEDITRITFLKGGVSLLFYRSAFADDLTEAERKLLFHIGSLMQLENDVFDVYKDRRDQIRTLITTTKDIRNIRKIYEALMKKSYDLARQTTFPRKNQDRFLDLINLIVCRGLVGLDQLEAIQKTTHNIFDLQAYSRKQLICDMEKNSNRWKMINYYLRKQ